MKQPTVIPSTRLQKRLSQTVLLLIWLTCVSLELPFTAFAQTNDPVPLPPTAQEALDKGIIAANVPDYLLAIRYFEEARKAAPQAPVIYLNMGLAESKIPGRELRAIAWFGAYLAAYPDAPNAMAVKEQMNVLVVRNQSNVSRLIKSVQDAASQTSDSRGSGGFQIENLLHVATLWLDFGDMTAALKTANFIHGNHDDRARGGLYRSMAYERIASVQADNGDIAGAQKTTGLIQLASQKCLALVTIATAQFNAGDLAGAKSTLTAALKSADLINTEPSLGIQSMDYVQGERQSYIASTQAIVGDIAGAQKTSDLIKFPVPKSFAQISISEALIKSGNIMGAQKTLVSAQKTADLIDYASHKNIVQAEIIRVQSVLTSATKPTQQAGTQPQTVIQVSNWLKILDDDNKNNSCPLNTEPFLDLTGYLKSLPPNDSQQIFNGMFNAANKIVSAQMVISQILKQGVRK